MLGKCQGDCTRTTRKTEGIYKSIGLHKAFIKVGIPSFKKALNYSKYRIKKAFMVALKKGVVKDFRSRACH